MELLSLFPTDIYVERNIDIDNKKLSKIILEKEKTQPSLELTNEGGWQSSHDLYKDKRFSEIFESISKYFKFISKNYGYVEDAELFITYMWANVNRYKDYNINHTHEGADWSFVYYIKIPKECGNLIFVDPRIRKKLSGANEWIESYDNPFTHDIYFVEPSEGKFVIFPSYLEHYVKFNLSKQPRISISGNLKVGI